MKSRALPDDTPFQDPKFGILYEMEYVESSFGNYPSTEGFLRLLACLFKCSGCPPNLGSNWRVRPGSLPYLEYVMQHVLPRASGVGPKTSSPLHFRVNEDRSRLECLALHVVESIILSYTIPTESVLKSFKSKPQNLVEELNKASKESMSDQLKNRTLENHLLTPLHDSVEAEGICSDFVDDPFYANLPSSPRLGNQTTYYPVEENAKQLTIPRPRMPGYAVLVDLLSTSSSTFLHALLAVLTGEREGIVLGHSVHDFKLVQALYLATPPTYGTAEIGGSRFVSSRDHLSLVSKGSPTPTENDTFEDSMPWSAESLRSATAILFGVLVRQDAFKNTCELFKQPSYVPTLQFPPFQGIPRPERLHLPPVTGLFFNVAPSVLQALWFSLISMVGLTSQNPAFDTKMSSLALGTLFYIFRNLDSPQQTRDILQASQSGITCSKLLAESLARRLDSYRGLLDSDEHSAFFTYILEGILVDIRHGHTSTFAYTLFEPDSPLFTATVSLATWDGLLDVDAKLACTCLEIIFRLTELSNDLANNVAVGRRSNYLQSVDFWLQTSQRILSRFDPSIPYLRLSLAWILKGIGEQIRLLSGPFMGMNCFPDIDLLFAPKPDIVFQYFERLFGEEGVVFKALGCLSLAQDMTSALSAFPSELVHTPEAQEAVASSTTQAWFFPGNSGTVLHVDGQKLLCLLHDKKIDADGQELLRWTQEWNQSVTDECEAGFLSEAINIIIGAVHSTKSSNFELVLTGFQRLQVALLLKLASSHGQRPSSTISHYSNAGRKLASSFFLVTDVIFGSNAPVEAELRVLELSMQSLICMSAGILNGRHTGDKAIADRECVMLLTTSLCQMASASATPLSEVGASGDYENMLVSILEVSLMSFDETGFKIRSMVPELMDFSRCVPDEAYNVCQHVLNREVKTFSGGKMNLLEACLGLLPQLDDSVASLLNTFSLVEGIPKLFLNSDILRRLQEAADISSQAETVHMNSNNLVRSQMPTPSFLLGHIKLVSAVLDQPDLNYLTGKAVLRILRSHEGTFSRLFDQFPLDGDIPFAIVRCLNQVLDLPDQHHMSEEWNLCSGMVKGVVRLSFHLAHHPLPDRFLQTQSPFDIPYEQHSSQTSWWKIANNESPTSRSIDKETCSLAILGSEFAREGLILGLKRGIISNGAELRLLCQCFRRCASAVVLQQNSTSFVEQSDEIVEFLNGLTSLTSDLLRVSLEVLAKLEWPTNLKQMLMETVEASRLGSAVSVVCAFSAGACEF